MYRIWLSQAVAGVLAGRTLFHAHLVFWSAQMPRRVGGTVPPTMLGRIASDQETPMPRRITANCSQPSVNAFSSGLPAHSPANQCDWGELDDDQLRRWAQLIGNGEAEFPSDVPMPTGQQLMFYVREVRRQRLLSFVARAIATDIYASREH